jgi:hypothetical protein
MQSKQKITVCKVTFIYLIRCILINLSLFLHGSIKLIMIANCCLEFISNLHS